MKHSGYGNGMMQVAMHSSKGRTKTKGEGILLPSPQEQDSMLEQKESSGKQSWFCKQLRASAWIQKANSREQALMEQYQKNDREWEQGIKESKSKICPLACQIR